MVLTLKRVGVDEVDGAGDAGANADLAHVAQALCQTRGQAHHVILKTTTITLSTTTGGARLRTHKTLVFTLKQILVKINIAKRHKCGLRTHFFVRIVGEFRPIVNNQTDLHLSTVINFRARLP